MSASLAIESTFRVGKFKVTLSAPANIEPGRPLALHCEWDPRLPGRPLTPSEWAQYVAGRDKAVADLAERAGLRIAVVNL